MSYSIQSTNSGHSHATALLTAAKKHYMAQAIPWLRSPQPAGGESECRKRNKECVIPQSESSAEDSSRADHRSQGLPALLDDRFVREILQGARDLVEALVQDVLSPGIEGRSTNTSHGLQSIGGPA
jgi:hypothetical protein